MKPPASFAFSTYLTLACSTAALAYMERLHVPGISVYYLAIEILLLGAFLLRDRWFLPRRAANVIALLVSVLWLGWFWMEMRLVSSQNPFALDLMPWVMPRIGPVLSFLMLAKMVRPKKTRDYWLLHALALTQIALSCVLGRDALFGLLLLSYFTSAVWSLQQFHQYREKGSDSLDSRPAQPARTLGEGLRNAFAWTMAGLVVGLSIFFVLPRRGQGLLLAEGTVGVTGFNPTGVDLHSVGHLDVSSDLVMRVDARNIAGEPVNLGAEQYWRGLTCTHYRDGHWRPFPPRPANDEVTVDFPELPKNPAMAADELFLTFQVDMLRTRRGSRNLALDGPSMGRDFANPIGPLLFVAEPPAFEKDRRGKPREPWRVLVHVNDSRVGDLIYRSRENTLHSPVTFRNGRLAYHQVCKRPFGVQHQWSEPITWWRTPLHEGALQGTSALSTNGLFSNPATPLGALIPFCAISEIEEETNYPETTANTLFQTPADPRFYYRRELYKVPVEASVRRSIRRKAEEILDQSDLLKARDEQKAIALERYLAGSGRYTYSFDRLPRERGRDPTVEFLLNTKVGHCEHFASALALMLRSHKIPARVVTGFHGADWNPYGQFHEIRQFHAHAWVEALIPRQTQPNELPEYRWLTLDPTPPDAIEAARAAVSQRWFAREIQFLVFLWEAFVLDYGEEQQGDMAEDLPSLAWLRDEKTWESVPLPTLEESSHLALAICGFMLIVVTGAIIAWWRQRRRGAAFVMKTRVAFYRRALRTLSRLGLRPRAAQTPREFADETMTRLLKHPEGREAGAATDNLTIAFYQVRYGGVIPESEMSHGIERDLASLARAVRSLRKSLK